MKKIDININNSKLCLLYSDPNGDLFEHNHDTYWVINDTYLEVKSYSNKNDILFRINDNDQEEISFEIHNILYTKDDFILENINNGLSIFNIEEYDIKISIIKEIPNDVRNGIRKNDITYKIRECKLNKIIK